MDPHDVGLGNHYQRNISCSQIVVSKRTCNSTHASKLKSPKVKAWHAKMCVLGRPTLIFTLLHPTSLQFTLLHSLHFPALDFALPLTWFRWGIFSAPSPYKPPMRSWVLGGKCPMTPRYLFVGGASRGFHGCALKWPAREHCQLKLGAEPGQGPEPRELKEL